MLKIAKRDGTVVDFDKSKIYNAIMKAMTFGSNIVSEEIARDIADEIEKEARDMESIDIHTVESMVFEKLCSKGAVLTAKEYERYRSIREFQRETINSTDGSILSLLAGTNKYLQEENSNKDAMLITTQRDYMAGEVSTDITRRLLLPPDIVEAHDIGILHFHNYIVA